MFPVCSELLQRLSEIDQHAPKRPVDDQAATVAEFDDAALRADGLLSGDSPDESRRYLENAERLRAIPVRCDG